jgi:thioredoxin-dependent peroxiredoxin
MMSSKPDVGSIAPDFELPGTGGKTYRLSSYGGQNVILAFYPGDFTPVCTRQFCSYRDDGDRIEQLDAQMLGISPQSVSSHERWATENGLTVPLLSDHDRRIAKLYGVLGPMKLVRRSIFLIDGERVIRYRQVAALGLTYQDAEDLERAVAAVA